MAPNIGLGIQHMAIICQLVELLLLFVGEDNVGVEGLHHQQSLTQRAGAFPQHLWERCCV